MKFLFLLAAITFVASSAELIVVKYHLDQACDDGSLFQLATGELFSLGCNNGVEKYVIGNYLKVRSYSKTDCTGTGGSVTNLLELNKCTKTPGNSTLHSKAIVMSDADFDGYLKGPGNAVVKSFGSDDCTGTEVGSGIILDTINGKCINNKGNEGAIMSWDDTKRITKGYATSDCSGTVTGEEEVRMNVCLNNTNSNQKLSQIWSANPPATSSAVRLTGLKSAMGFGIIFLTSYLY